MKKALLSVILVLITLLLSACGADTEPLRDGKVYSRQYLYGDLIYYSDSKSGLSSAHCDSSGNKYKECINPLCTHDERSGCESYIFNLQEWVSVDTDESGFPLIYMFGWRNKDIYVDGEWINNPDIDLGRVRVYDTRTAQGYDIAELDFSYAHYMAYRNGMLYMSVKYDKNGGDYPHKVGALDISTGEWKEISAEANAKIVGIWNERVYYITTLGNVYSVDMELDDERLEYECGADILGESYFHIVAYMDGGVLYYAKNFRYTDPVNYIGVWDIYAADLDSGKEAVMIADDVHTCYPCEGDLYYIPSDRENVYVYDSETNESKLCCSEIGISVNNIFETADGAMLFGGTVREDDTEISYYMCKLDLDTGEWKIALEER